MDSATLFDKVAIVGPGLVGGSMGLGLKRRGLAGSVIGIGRRRESLDAALALGAVDTATLDAREGVKDADLIVLATPISAIEGLMGQIADAVQAEAILTDVASTKARVIEVVSSALSRRPDVAYIPTHPMAGSEKGGVQAADPDLFVGSVCIITPLTDTYPETKAVVTRMWRALGARVASMGPQAHDRAVAAVSHMPHLAAAALMAAVDQSAMALCGKGLLDTTRVASGSPDMWLDICDSNRQDIHRSLVAYIEVLKAMADALRDGSLGPVRDVLEQAKSKRDRLLEARRDLLRRPGD